MGKDNGGPAFPVSETVIDDKQFQPDFQGMTLRDYFAAKVASGLATHSSYGSITEDSAGYMAEEAYMIADAMIAERSKGE